MSAAPLSPIADPLLRDAAAYLRAYFIARQHPARASPLRLVEHERLDDLFFLACDGHIDRSAVRVPCNKFGAGKHE